MRKSIAIIGGSIAGLSAALFFASAKNEELDFDITVFDEGKADLKVAAITMFLFSQRVQKQMKFTLT